MKTRFLPRRCILAASAAVAALGALMPAFAGTSSGPIGDLTVTVEERSDGGVDFTLSGSTVYKHSTGFYSTPYDWATSTPPTSGGLSGNSIQLPEGLAFILNDSHGSDAPEGEPSANGYGQTSIPVRYYYTSGSVWYLTVDSGYSYAPAGTGIAGTGKIEVPEIPFTNFVEGTFTVEGYYFDMTYRVIPFVAPAPAGRARLRVPSRQRFTATAVGRSRTASLRIANVGDAAANGVSVSVRGSGSRHFRVAGPQSSRIAPGGATTCRVTYRPNAAGTARANAVVRSNAPTVSTALVGQGRAAALSGGPRFPLKRR